MQTDPLRQSAKVRVPPSEVDLATEDRIPKKKVGVRCNTFTDTTTERRKVNVLVIDGR